MNNDEIFKECPMCGNEMRSAKDSFDLTITMCDCNCGLSIDFFEGKINWAWSSDGPSFSTDVPPKTKDEFVRWLKVRAFQ